ncbi:hypothetical protein [Paenibacillus pinistramenti]|uniref:hypothetical protein n=1 Tax=Paenibacillus pinistramenti TaxID=1768003 RepID=UPI0011088BE2|nr:hypothetical protein [Paenibacillus pinistramenti]
MKKATISSLKRGQFVAVAYQTPNGIRVANGRLVSIHNPNLGPTTVVLKQGVFFRLSTGRIVFKKVTYTNVVRIQRFPSVQ